MVCKPDLVLSADDADPDWRDVIVFGEVKSINNYDSSKASFKEIAGKTSVVLCAQDGRHAAPSLRILGSDVGLIFFDRGGSLETCLIDVHGDPELFLRLLVGLTAASPTLLGSDIPPPENSDGDRRVLITQKGTSETKEIKLDSLLFISDALHGRGTTVWAASMDSNDPKSPHSRTPVVVKDSWIDPLRKYSEGYILATLNDAGVTGVPTLLQEQQVQVPHPTRPDELFNSSTHLIHALLPPANRNVKGRQYQLRVLSRLITTPVGLSISNFDSLTELLVVFIDYVVSE